MCTGEYLSRNKNGWIIPCDTRDPIQYFLTYLAKDSALEKASQTHRRMERRLLKYYSQ